MNCIPGDMAIVVRAPGPQTGAMVGKVLRVTRPVLDAGEWCWEYEGPRVLFSQWGSVDLIEDEFLRPIRDPGEDARDETLDWLPVPTEELA